jgi:hypothetical protein
VPARPRVVLHGFDQVAELEHLDPDLGKPGQALRESLHDGVPVPRRDQLRQELVVPALGMPLQSSPLAPPKGTLQLGLLLRRIAPWDEAEHRVVADPGIAREHVERAGLDQAQHGGAGELEDPVAQRIVALLRLVEEVAQAEENQAVDVGPYQELLHQARQTADEHERIAVEQEVFEQVALAPARAAIDAEVARGSAPQGALLHLVDQCPAQHGQELVEAPRVRGLASRPQRADERGKIGGHAKALPNAPAGMLPPDRDSGLSWRSPSSLLVLPRAFPRSTWIASTGLRKFH